MRRASSSSSAGSAPLMASPKAASAPPAREPALPAEESWEELARKAEEAAADLSQPVPAEAAAPIAASPQAAVLAGATTRATAKQPGLPKAAGPKSSETLVALALRRQYLKELFLDCISHGWSKYSQGPFRLLVLQGECGMEGLRASICWKSEACRSALKHWLHLWHLLRHCLLKVSGLTSDPHRIIFLWLRRNTCRFSC